MWLKLGRAALTDADRAKVLRPCAAEGDAEHLWMPVLNINMDEVVNKKGQGHDRT